MIDERYVLDASALLAMLAREPGGDAVAMVLAACATSAVNWSEVLQKSRAHGVHTDGLDEELRGLGLELLPFGVAEAEVAAAIWHEGNRQLAFADRACLATARVAQCPVMTADQAWASMDVGVRVELIR